MIAPEQLVVHDAQPRAPASVEERFWAVSQVQLFGIVLPNCYQTCFFAVLCIALALPVFCLDKSGRSFYHGLVTLGSLAAFAAFCWIVGMILADTSSKDSPKKQ